MMQVGCTLLGVLMELWFVSLEKKTSEMIFQRWQIYTSRKKNNFPIMSPALPLDRVGNE